MSHAGIKSAHHDRNAAMQAAAEAAAAHIHPVHIARMTKGSRTRKILTATLLLEWGSLDRNQCTLQAMQRPTEQALDMHRQAVLEACTAKPGGRQKQALFALSRSPPLAFKTQQIGVAQSLIDCNSES